MTKGKGLGSFEGRQVLSTSVAIRNTGDGLSESMTIEPEVIRAGTTRYVLLEVDVDKIRYDPIKDVDGLERVHMCKALRAVFVDKALAIPLLDEMSDRIEAAREEASGQSRLTADVAREVEHDQGLHKTLKDDCPKCQEEIDAEAAGD